MYQQVEVGKRKWRSKGRDKTSIKLSEGWRPGKDISYEQSCCHIPLLHGLTPLTKLGVHLSYTTTGVRIRGRRMEKCWGLSRKPTFETGDFNCRAGKRETKFSIHVLFHSWNQSLSTTQTVSIQTSYILESWAI